MIISRILVWAGFALFGLMTILSVALFSQKGDISHTIHSSYAYLQGQLVNFYDFNVYVVGENNYLPTVYIIFAIWMLPLHVLGLTSSVDLSGGVIPKPLEMNLLPLELLWAKLALILAFVISVYIFRELAKRAFGDDSRRTWLTTLSFATAPLAFFAVGIFNQYDVFGVLFTLLGLLFLVDGKHFRFTLFFGLAISLKFFAMLLVVPLILYFVNSWFDRLKAFLAVFLVPVILSLPYLTSEAFRSGVLFLVNDRATDPFFLASLPFTIVLYGAIVFWSWRLNKANTDSFRVLALIGLGVYSILFTSVFFHPQWLIVITPFIALAVGYVKPVSSYLWLETVGFFAFTWYMVNMWPMNVDSVMILNGPLSSLFFFQPQPLSLFYTLDLSPIFLLIFEVVLLVLALFPLAFVGKPDFSRNSISIPLALVVRGLSPLFLIIVPTLFSSGVFA